MLKLLYVKDFAIIEDISVEFDKGMTVLTGETGAGKSLIIDSISLLLGARSDTDMIRYGKKKAIIEGVFTHNNVLNNIFEKNAIPVKDDIVIHREILDSSRTIIKVNDANITLTILKQIASYLADIHIQNDTFKLFSPNSYLDLIDPENDNQFNRLMSQYSKALYDYTNSISSYNKIKNSQKNTIDRLDFLRYELEEIKGLELYPNKDIELNEKIARLANYDKIFTNLNEAYSSLENEYSSIDSIYNAAKALQKISAYSNDYLQNSERLLDSYYIISEIKDDLYRQINNLDYDEEELNRYNEQLNNINKAIDKYKMNVNQLIEYSEKINLEIQLVTNYDEVLLNAENEVKNQFNKLKAISIELSNYRKKISKEIERNIIEEAKSLDLENTCFEIRFEDINMEDPFNSAIFTEKGIDNPVLLISFNKGEPLKPLYKVASGGEMSRIMLAFKSYLSATSNLSLMVFDEIDTGVSGTTAKKIADKMHKIAQNVQVLCITHLPQVAAIGDNHLKIYKIEHDDRTYTKVDKLSFDERVEEIAIMLSGDKISLYALEHAKSLLIK
ncbi:MAG: DNA repair protein RecN [Anaeroplasma sp.]